MTKPDVRKSQNLITKNRRKWLVIIGALIPMMVLYGLTLGRYPIPFADSLELMTAGKIASLAHPPGYALQTIILYGLIWNLDGEMVALAANIFSAFLQILTLSISGLIIGNLGKLSGLEGKKQMIAIVLTIWTIGLGRYFWFSAGVFEVFSLNNLLIVSLIYIGIKILETGTWKYFSFFWGLMAGFALGHQQISLLVSLPLFALMSIEMFKRGEKRGIGRLCFGLILGLITTALATYLIGVKGNENWVSWRMSPNWQGVLSIMTRADYTGVLVELGSESHAYLKRFDLGESVEGFVIYWELLVNNYGLAGITLIIVSGYAVWRQKGNKWGKLLFGLWIISGLGLAVYLPIVRRPEISYKIEGILIERLYSQGYVLAGLLIGVGVVALLKILDRNEAKILVCLMLVSIIGQGLGNYRYANVSSLKQPWEEIETGLINLPQGSVLFCFGDWSCFGTIYAQAVENIRKDILIVPVTPQIRMKNWPVNNLVINYPDNPWRISERLGWARRENRPIGLMEINDNYKNWLGINNGNGYLVTVGENLEMWQCSGRKISNDTPTVPMENGNSPAHEYQQLTRVTNALKNNQETINSACLSAIELYNRGRICKGRNEPCAWINYMQAIMLEPENIDIRLELANYLVPLAPELAKREYKLVLKLDENNDEAKSMLSEMRSIKDLDNGW